MGLTDVLKLPSSGRYTNPEQPNIPLPLIYGNLAENSDAGVFAPPCIDTTNLVYAVAGWPILSEANGNVVTVYDGNLLLLPTDYTFDESDDYEGQGAIATLTLQNPPSVGITVSCKGKADGATLLTSPTAIIEDLLTYAETTGGLTLPTLNPTAWATAEAVVAANSYTAAGCLTAENSVAFWLTSILSSFLGAWYVNAQNELIVRFDTGDLNGFVVAGYLKERELQDITGRQRRNNLVNRLMINYAISYAQVDRRFSTGVNAAYFRTDDGATTADAASIFKYGVRYARQPLNFDWTRNTTTVQSVSARMIEKFATPTWLYTLTEMSFDNIHIEKGDFVTFSWEARRDETGEPLVNQICQVIGKEVDMDAETVTWQLIDYKIAFPADPYLWDGAHNTGDGTLFGGNRRSDPID